ncbi:MAG: AraC family transcriptional regulator ligand-binding domain-containing protein [Cyanobacteria bacterium P01_A01_bin.17]
MKGQTGAVSSQFIRKLVAAAEHLEDPAGLLASVGLPAETDAAAATQQMVAASAFYDLIDRLGVDNDAEFPFRYAVSADPDDFGALGLALKTAETLRGTLERLIRYFLLLTDTANYEFQDHAEGAWFVFYRPVPDRSAVRIANECALAAVVSLLRRASKSPVSPISVSFTHQRLTTTDSHRRYFGCSVSFEAEQNALLLSHELLDTKSALGDEGLSRFLLAHLDHDLQNVQQSRSLETQVKQTLADALSDGVPKIAQVARRLGMSERTLHRRLADCDRTFQTLVDETRHDVAESLLKHTDYSLADIAFLSGFAEQSSFQRAFKRWFQQTPAAFRKAMQSS